MLHLDAADWRTKGGAAVGDLLAFPGFEVGLGFRVQGLRA